MKLLEIEIRNLKSITTALFTFPVEGRHQVALLYGDNGAGKTTVLEAISLLGHVSTMRRVCLSNSTLATTPSSFRTFKTAAQNCAADNSTALRATSAEQYNADAFSDDYALLRDNGIDGWWSATSVGGDFYRPARIRYLVQFNNQPMEFYISFLQRKDLSITEALSRDQTGPGSTIHDGNMDNWFAIVYPLAAREQVESFIEHMRLVSPHSYRNADGDYHTDPRTLKRPDSHSIVGYWNTDLNDFGRKNDLRESVKKIRIDFVGQMINRLGLALPYGPPHEPTYYELTTQAKVTTDKLDILNDSLKKGLVDHALAMEPEQHKQKAGLIRIAEIDATQEPATMKARRINEDVDIEIDHLSAGENESVFIYLLMHGMPCKDSIILLDEPDLHLSDFARSRFYTELYRIASAAACQLIISTHSAFAYQNAAHFSHFFIRRERERDAHGASRVVYRTDWGDAFGELLTFHYARCAVNAMSQAGPMWTILSLPLRGSIRVGEKVGVPLWVFITFVVAAFGLYATLATVNDLLFIVDYDPLLHRHVIQGALIFSFMALLIGVLQRFASQWMRAN